MTQSSSRVLVFTATYNERDNILPLVREIHAAAPGADVLFVDDHSPDGTGAVLDELAGVDPLVRVVHRPGKLGLGTAHLLAMIYAIQHGYDALVTMDADLSHDPRDIPRLLEHLGQADFVIGSRYMPGGECNYHGYRRVMSVAANRLARLLLGIPLHEFTTSFRAFRVASLARVNFVKMHNQGYSFFMESVHRLRQAGLGLAEIPIVFRDRTAGESKIPRFEIVRGAAKLLHLTVSRLVGRRMPPAGPLIRETCVNCASAFLSERFAPRLPEGVPHSSAYRCSSMEHTSKPRVAKCLQCGMSQVPGAEQPAALEAMYEDVVDQDYLGNLAAKRRTFARAYRQLRPFLPAPARLLEIGSYCGLFLAEARSQGWSVKGIEPSRWAAEYSRERFGVDVTQSPFEAAVGGLGGGFDAVASWDVIEHVRNPRQFVRLAGSQLRDGGVLALSTIDIDSTFARAMGARWPWIMEMHLHYFGSRSLERMLEEEGFEVVHVAPYVHYASLRYIFRKVCASLAGAKLAGLAAVVPEIVLPVALGDVKVYVAVKRGVA